MGDKKTKNGHNGNNGNHAIDPRIMAEVKRLAEASRRGDLKARTNVQDFSGDAAEIMETINLILDEALTPIDAQAEVLARMAEGDLSVRITQDFKGDHNRIKQAINEVARLSEQAQAEIQRGVEASRTGNLKTRADLQKFKGDWHEIMAGINTILDEALAPIDAQADVLARMTEGDLSARITQEFRGDHVRIKDLLNRLQVFNQQVVEDIVTVSQMLAEGNLRAELQGDYQGDFRRIKEAMETAIAGLNSTVRQTTLVAQQTGQAIEQLRAVSQDLAANATEQSSAVAEVTSNLTETAAQVKTNADSAASANQLVNQTASTANTGRKKMESMTQAMAAIADSSREIGKIIKVIDEIAFQTNLLALNAAVEAARAGQHGRGFAVVAQEVRNLAGRSAKAAKETSELIADAGHRVNEGVEIVKETAESLDEIVLNVVKVKDLVGEIAAASQEQAQGVTQINAAMLQLSEGVQGSSQQSQELASTADELAGLAGQLNEEVGRFRLAKQQIAPEMLAGLPAGLTPQMLQQIADMLRQQGQHQPAARPAPKSKPAKPQDGGAAKRHTLDRDVRGYEDF